MYIVKKIGNPWIILYLARSGSTAHFECGALCGISRSDRQAAPVRALRLHLRLAAVARLLLCTILRIERETEKNIAQIFATAKANHAMLLFDEADSLFTSRVKVER